MYNPETSLTGFGDKVIVLVDANTFMFGTYTGKSSYNGESFEIRTEDLMSGNTRTEFFHKEDIFKNTEENLQRVREITQC